MRATTASFVCGTGHLLWLFLFDFGIAFLLLNPSFRGLLMQLFEPLCFSIGRLFRTCQSTTVTVGRLFAWCFLVKVESFYIEHVGASRVKLRCILSIVSFSQLLEPIFFTFNVTNNTLMHDFTVCGLFPVRVVDGGGGGYDNSCKSG